MQQQHDPMERWTREGFQPEIVENAEGKFTLEFGQDGGLVPEWADWSVGPIWHESPQQAIDAALGNEAMAAAYRRALDKDRSWRWS